MKKLALLAAILLLCGLTAAVAETTVEVSGSASATFGYNLQNEAMGFDNDLDLSFVVMLVPEQTKATDAESGWYGWIEFADFGVGFNNDDESDYYWYAQAGPDDVLGPLDPDAEVTPYLYVKLPDVTAKITNGPFYVKVYSAPSFDADHATYIENDEDDDWFGMLDQANDRVEQDWAGVVSGGITIGYDTDMFGLAVYVADSDGWGAGSGSDDWLFGVNVTVSAFGFDLSGDVATAVNVADNDLYFGADVSYTLDLGLGSLVPYVGFDFYNSDALTEAALELAAGADLTFTNSNTFGVAFYMNDLDDSIDFTVTFVEDGAAGFVPGLGAELFFGAYDVVDRYDIGVDVSYMIDAFKPFAGFKYGYRGEILDTAGASANAGIEWTGIPNTTVTLEWESGDLLTTPNAQAGEITLTAKVEM